MEAFYRQFESRVYAFALNRLNDPHAAADIVHEVMLAVWRGAGRFEGASKVTTWLLGIARNKVVDRMRKRGAEMYDELDPDTADTRATAQADAIAGAQDARRLHECLRALSEAHREVVHLAFFEDMSYGEIAAVVGCPEGTVKTRMFHARRALRGCLGEV